MSSSFPDLRTLFFTLALLSTVISVVMLYIWRTDRTYPGFGLWSIGNVFAAFGYFFVSFNDLIPSPLVVFGVTFTMAGFALAYEGIRRFRGRPPGKFISIGFVVSGISAFIVFTHLLPNLVYRVSLVSLLIAAICSLCAYELVRKVAVMKRYTHWLTALFFLLNSLLMLSRSVLTFFFSDIQLIYQPDVIQSTFTLTQILCFVGWSFCFVVLNSERLQEELIMAQIKLEKLATTDFLTGLNNGRHFFEIGLDEINRARRNNHPMSLIMFDIDHFKRVNDRFGHAAGDKVLSKIAEICQNNLRSVDIIGRLGGEEFAVILPNTLSKYAFGVAEHLRTQIETCFVEFFENQINVTASFGISELREQDEKISEPIMRADEALYKAKAGGRNRVYGERS